jgi:hypothetical protein
MKTDTECAIHGVTEEIKFFVSIVGIGFNPDTDFADYVIVDAPRGFEKLCSRRAAAQMNRRLNECFAMCEKYNLDIYEISLSIVQPLINK